MFWRLFQVSQSDLIPPFVIHRGGDNLTAFHDPAIDEEAFKAATIVFFRTPVGLQRCYVILQQRYFNIPVIAGNTHTTRVRGLLHEIIPTIPDATTCTQTQDASEITAIISGATP